MTQKNNRFFLLCIFVLTLMFGGVSVADAQSKKDRRKAEQLYEQGARAFNAKNYRVAIERYAESIVIVPNNSKAHYWKGYAHYYLNEFDPALSELNTAAGQGHPVGEIAAVRWYVHKEKKDYDAALSDIQIALQARPNDQNLLINAGDIYFDKGSMQEALAAYQKALLSMPNNGDLYYKVALIQEKLGNREAQKGAAAEAVAKNTQYLADANRLLGDAHFNLRENDAAIVAYTKAIASNPNLYQAYRNLTELYRAQSRLDDAIEICKKTLRVFPNDGNVYTDISWFYSLKDQHENAIEAAKAGIRLLPNQYMAYTNLCRAYNDTGKPELAVNYCNSALRLNPNDGETSFYLGRSFALQGKQAEAKQYYERAVNGLLKYTKDFPDYSDGYYLLGNALFANGQSERAIQAYRRCLELSPRFSRARFNMGYVQVVLKNKTAAMEQYNSLLSLDQSLAGKLKVEIDKL